jgi:hypothetical protein
MLDYASTPMLHHIVVLDLRKFNKGYEEECFLFLGS